MEKIRPPVSITHSNSIWEHTSALFNMSVPPRTTFEAVVKPVVGRFLVFKLPAPATPLSKKHLDGPIFQAGLEGLPTREEVEAAAGGIPAFLIGIQLQGGIANESLRMADTARTIAVLSRRVGEIYVRSRQPNYTAEHLYLQKPFAVEAWEGIQ
jgi:hypothetical protein